MWDRKGIVFAPDGSSVWMQSHAFLPTAVLLEDCIRVFVAFRDKMKLGRIGFVDVDIDDPCKVIRYSREPVLDIGLPGQFDEHGVSPLSAVFDGDGRLRLYYAGWQRHPEVRYFLFTGMAVSDDQGLTFSRCQDVPVIDRSPGIWQVRTGGSFHYWENKWHVWYAEFCGQGYNHKNDLIPRYHWSYMSSEDGLHWPEKGNICLQAQEKAINGYGRAAILRRGDNSFESWVSVRTSDAGYRIGYCTSKDGLNWSEIDHRNRGLLPRETGFDSEETAYASIIRHPQDPDKLIMFYNGRGYGKDGFAVATGIHGR